MRHLLPPRRRPLILHRLLARLLIQHSRSLFFQFHFDLHFVCQVFEFLFSSLEKLSLSLSLYYLLSVSLSHSLSALFERLL